MTVEQEAAAGATPEEPSAAGPAVAGPAVRFTMRGIASGYVAALPVAASAAVFGLAFGLLAGQKGLSVVETGLMSSLVFAGAAQMLALELWETPVPILGLTLAALIINLRYLVLGAALTPWLGRLPWHKAYGSLFLMADENWALSVAEMRRGGTDAGYFLGTGLSLFTFWVTCGVLGRLSGALVEDPARFGLDFVGTAVFTALLITLWRGRGDILPWAVAAAVALLAAELWPGTTWYLVLGGLAGSLAGAVRDGR